MRAVLVLVDVGRVDYEVPSVDVVGVSVAVVVNARLSVKLGLVSPRVLLQVGVVCLESAVDYRDDNVRFTGLLLPCLEQVDVSAGNRALQQGSVVVVVPLL